MIDITEEQPDFETKYSNEHQPTKEQTGRYMNNHGKDIDLPTLTTLSYAQANDLACNHLAGTVWVQKSMFTFNTEGALAVMSRKDGASHRYIPTMLRPCNFHICYYFLLPGLPVERRVDDATWQPFHWPHTAEVLYALVTRWLSCPWNRRKNKKQRILCLFSPASTLDFVFISIFGP